MSNKEAEQQLDQIKNHRIIVLDTTAILPPETPGAGTAVVTKLLEQARKLERHCYISIMTFVHAHHTHSKIGGRRAGIEIVNRLRVLPLRVHPINFALVPMASDVKVFGSNSLPYDNACIIGTALWLKGLLLHREPDFLRLNIRGLRQHYLGSS